MLFLLKQWPIDTPQQIQAAISFTDLPVRSSGWQQFRQTGYW